MRTGELIDLSEKFDQVQKMRHRAWQASEAEEKARLFAESHVQVDYAQCGLNFSHTLDSSL